MSNLRAPIESWRSQKTAVRASEIHGRGLFSTGRFRQGDLVFVKSGAFLTNADLAALDPSLRHFCLQIERDLFIGARSVADIEATTIFANHACDANVVCAGQISFLAVRDIEPEEEICYDYGTTTTTAFQMHCCCRGVACRSVITGDDWKSPVLRAKGLHVFSNFIQRMILEELTEQSVPVGPVSPLNARPVPSPRSFQ